MSWQPSCAIAQPRAAQILALPLVAVDLHLQDSQASCELERWSG
jgi:hypothetical protein